MGAAVQQDVPRSALVALSLPSLELRLPRHFLSKALGAIGELVTTDPPRAQAVLEQFASLLRVFPAPDPGADSISAGRALGGLGRAGAAELIGKGGAGERAEFGRGGRGRDRWRPAARWLRQSQPAH